MKIYKPLLIILVIFLKTGNVLSSENIFSVNNIQIDRNKELSNEQIANQAIKKGFKELTTKILLEEDVKKISGLSLSEIKNLILYYQLQTSDEPDSRTDQIIFNVFFDKNKLHDLFFKRSISYSEIQDKEIYLLPILIKDDQIFIYNNNFFYESWNSLSESELIEFILPIENIEIFQKVIKSKDNLINLNLEDLFREYPNKNLAYVLIDASNSKKERVYIKIKILDKYVEKNINVNSGNLDKEDLYKNIIAKVNKEITNLVKAENLIDVRTPSFLNTKLLIRKDKNLVELKKRLKKIDLIDNIYVLEFNNEYIFLKIKYLGKIDKIIQLLRKEKIILQLIEEQWRLKII